MAHCGGGGLCFIDQCNQITNLQLTGGLREAGPAFLEGFCAARGPAKGAEDSEVRFTTAAEATNE